MKIEIEEHLNIAVLKVTEGLTGDESDDLVSTVQQILEEGTRLFVVDLVESGKIDSGGLGNLVRAYTVVAKQNGRIVLALPSNFFKTHRFAWVPHFALTHCRFVRVIV